ncbi:MAG: MFS transporter [Gemmatimonadota bacterium]
MKSTWLERWEPESPEFWLGKGRTIAWQTLTITTIALVLSFATWFVMSAVVVRLPRIGFRYDTMQLFWLAAIPGLAGGTLRIVHTFLVPLFGTRSVVTIATLLKLIPCVGIGLAVMNPETPFWVFLLLAFSAGFGGGDFSSFMPSTSLFFPKRLQGTALGVQAGIGNFGVSLTQFVTPWIIGFAALGALAGGPQTFTAGEVSKPIWVQNATFWYVPVLLFVALLAWLLLRSVPIRASVKEQMDIFRDKHTWLMTSLYIMTFGSFSGLSAVFPLLIMSLYGDFPNAPDPLRYAYLGPLIGSAIRVIGGPLSDRLGGGILTQISGFGLVTCALAITPFLDPSSLQEFLRVVALMLGLFFFAGLGNASTFRQIPIIFAHSPRQGGGVLGWTAAVAAYGPFVFASLVGLTITSLGSPKFFFYGAAVFYAVNLWINWWYYYRRGAERPC